MSLDKAIEGLRTSDSLPNNGIQEELAAFEELEVFLAGLAPEHAARYGGYLIDLARSRAADKARIKELERIATTDELTGLPNRRGFVYGVEGIINKALRPAYEELGQTATATFGVMLMDLDKFKLINDTYGHDAGDRAIILAANALSAIVQRGEDKSVSIVSRLGGDEFSALFHISDQNPMRDAMHFAGRALHSLERQVDDDPEFSRIGLNGSFGVSAIIARKGDSNEDLAAVGLKKADVAMYRSKHKGNHSRIEFEH